MCLHVKSGSVRLVAFVETHLGTPCDPDKNTTLQESMVSRRETTLGWDRDPCQAQEQFGHFSNQRFFITFSCFFGAPLGRLGFMMLRLHDA